MNDLNFNLNDYDYKLPKELIANKAIIPKDNSKLLVINNDKLKHNKFYEIIDYFKKNDILILNNTKVLKNKLYGKKTTGANLDIIIEDCEDNYKNIYKCRVQTNYPKIGTVIKFENKLIGKIIDRENDLFLVEFNKSPNNTLKKFGKLPNPNYIRKQIENESEYQTMYAKNKGSFAAPTSGLHFTKELLAKIKNKGVKIVYITLHISFGTFKLIKEDKPISEHIMDVENYFIPKKTAELINKRKGRVIICGTTVFKALESSSNKYGIIKNGYNESNLFIYPGYKFNFKPDLMITNFHLPKSTLILFISAYFGKDVVLNAYKTAVKEKYRFFSLGDACLFIK
ncbi:MAG: tRNA preQ1(34) S-adenosylmethionine ribosyltransferase-isomerase QueA [Nanoarchaeota archaeon]